MKPSKSHSTSYQTIAIYWRYVRRYLPLFLVGSVGTVLAIIAQGMIPPYIIARIFNKLQYAYAHQQQLSFSDYLPYFKVYAVAMIAGVFFWRAQAYAIWRMEGYVQRDIANDIYSHIQSQSERFHADRFGGALVSQTTKFLGAYVRLIDNFIWNVIPSIVNVVISIGILAFLAWQYALVLTAITIVYLLSVSWRIRHQLPFNVAQANVESAQTAAYADAITNMATIRAFGSERYESKRFRKVTDHTHGVFRKLLYEILKTEAFSHIQTNGFQIISVFVALLAVTRYNLSVGVLYLGVTYTSRIVDQLWQFGRIVRDTNRAFGDASSMTEMLQIKPSVLDPEQPEKAHISQGTIVFDKVNFSYPENTRQALFTNLNLHIKPGEKVGLVGPSGGGKTTITKLLLRFANINGGRITIDGQDIAAITQEDLRTHIAYVSQEPILFHRSLAENIGYGQVHPDQQAVEAAAKMANAHEFISQLPHGYDTMVGERGVKLSGGQRQRVAIARAMLKNAPILVLDEATSALDSESEVLIQDALWKLMEGRTAIVIAHRLSTIQKMDRIIVLDGGQVVETGSHKQLLDNNGVYAKLWAHQSGGFIEGDDDE